MKWINATDGNAPLSGDFTLDIDVKKRSVTLYEPFVSGDSAMHNKETKYIRFKRKQKRLYINGKRIRAWKIRVFLMKIKNKHVEPSHEEWKA